MDNLVALIEQATIIQKIEEDSQNNEIYMKRDDLIPFSFGGNKLRKAILFFQAILAGNYNCVITYGSSSSNHCRIVANLAKCFQIPCDIISPSESAKETMNLKLIQLFGAQIISCPIDLVNQTIDARIEQRKRDGFHPFFIPGGGHGTLGTEAYVQAYHEIKLFEKGNGIQFDYIFHASGTGTTQAGLVCGLLKFQDLERKVVGISIARRNPRGRNVVIDSIREYCMQNGILSTMVEQHVNFIDQYILHGYGDYNQEILKEIQNGLFQNGIPMDTTYVGKAYWGMKNYIKDRKIENKKILFIHTGGGPLFFDDILNR